MDDKFQNTNEHKHKHTNTPSHKNNRKWYGVGIQPKQCTDRGITSISATSKQHVWMKNSIRITRPSKAYRFSISNGSCFMLFSACFWTVTLKKIKWNFFFFFFFSNWFALVYSLCELVFLCVPSMVRGSQQITHFVCQYVHHHCCIYPFYFSLYVCFFFFICFEWFVRWTQLQTIASSPM